MGARRSHEYTGRGVSMRVLVAASTGLALCSGQAGDEDSSGSWEPEPPPPDPPPPPPLDWYHCAAVSGGAGCAKGRGPGKNYNTADCDQDCSMYKCSGLGSNRQCLADPFGTFKTSRDCEEGCHAYRCDGSQCIQDDDHGTYFAEDCEESCHMFKCEVGQNETRQCVQDDQDGRYPDETCGRSCSSTPVPPKGDWKSCGACGCRGTDLSPLQNATFHAYDVACNSQGGGGGSCHTYAFRLCGAIPVDELPLGCREFAEGPDGKNISLLRYSKDNPSDCEPFTICDGPAGAGQRACPLDGRKDADGFGLELELRFAANAKGMMQCSSSSSDVNSTEDPTLTFIMSKGEQPNPQRVFDNSSIGGGGGSGSSSSCSWVARWAGLPENPPPELVISHEDSIYAWIAGIVVVAAGGSAILGISKIVVRDKCGSGGGSGVARGSRPSSEAYADWTPGSRDSAASSSRSSAGGAGGGSEVLLQQDLGFRPSIGGGQASGSSGYVSIQ